ncbi:hypothetical protein Q73A0000_04205 [Kaistella flava (ex Peng et al. 2021)]|uniref:Type II toxin-antitoxin system RelE/ParE family toxin n=1 Tax=Kaistella flava (ex Peng et al. 2021) TaxID=2038776 RepID=A0A7M2Y7H7_9FLAO|nr:hypothetical protein [Kaistella flava (ex Peng et al. 2021)]QOW09624.1 hypothetical protein Q73A0000_04205 [Kaistella flava (ex Peng et al. 2021)]
MVGQIIYSAYFISQLDHLAKILYIKQYFSYLEDVDNYIDEIYDVIENNIENSISQNAPEPFRKFGKYFLSYKVNKHAYWYVFFDQKDNHFIINHILNNHSQDFPELS